MNVLHGAKTVLMHSTKVALDLILTAAMLYDKKPHSLTFKTRMLSTYLADIVLFKLRRMNSVAKCVKDENPAPRMLFEMERTLYVRDMNPGMSEKQVAETVKSLQGTVDDYARMKAEIEHAIQGVLQVTKQECMDALNKLIHMQSDYGSIRAEDLTEDEFVRVLRRTAKLLIKRSNKRIRVTLISGKSSDVSINQFTVRGDHVSTTSGSVRQETVPIGLNVSGDATGVWETREKELEALKRESGSVFKRAWGWILENPWHDSAILTAASVGAYMTYKVRGKMKGVGKALNDVKKFITAA